MTKSIHRAQMLSCNLGQVVVLNGSPSSRYLIVGILKNLMFSSFENHYVLTKTHTLLGTNVASESIISHIDDNENIFDSFTSYELLYDKVVKIYEALCRQAVTYFEGRTKLSEREHCYEIIDKQLFMDLVNQKIPPLKQNKKDLQ